MKQITDHHAAGPSGHGGRHRRAAGGPRREHRCRSNVTDDHAHGVIFLEAEPYDEALRVLAEAGYHAISEESDRHPHQGRAGRAGQGRGPVPGAADQHPRRCAFVRRDGGWATVILSTERQRTRPRAAGRLPGLSAVPPNP